ncbi:MAG: hypothetical protein IJN46_01435 [Lachnospiraceae bacterium]|nr:hypothetical protein [Lachnospiraceae bacterium]
MSANTKIVVFKKKELLYTLIFIGLAVILVVLLITMFGKKETYAPTGGEVAASYIPGIYTSPINLGNQSLEVEVCVDEARIKSIRFTDLSEAVTTVYPLMAPSMETLAEQIITNQSAENVSYAESSKYTCAAILNAIRTALGKAEITEP